MNVKPMPWSPLGTGPFQRVFIEDAELYVRCGLHNWERDPENPNRLLVSVEMWSRTAFDGQAASGYIDYDAVRQQLLTWPDRDHTDLLETLIDELMAFCFRDSLVEACRVRIAKPDIFPEAASAGVEWFRMREAAG